MARINLDWLDVCVPCYFQGHGGETVAVAVDGRMTIAEAVDAIVDEINGADLDVWEDVDGDEITDDEIRRAARGLFRDGIADDAVAFPEIEIETEDEDEDAITFDGPYLYLAVSVDCDDSEG